MIIEVNVTDVNFESFLMIINHHKLFSPFNILGNTVLDVPTFAHERPFHRRRMDFSIDFGSKTVLNTKDRPCIEEDAPDKISIRE